MNASTQKVPEEKTAPGHHGGSDDEHRCWRCALKKAIAAGIVSTGLTFAQEYGSEDFTDAFKKAFSKTLSREKLVRLADMVHRVTIELDEMTGRSTEVH